MTTSENRSEPGWDIFTRAQRGEESAWRVLVSQFQPRLLAIATLITGDGSVAEEIVQETFTRSLVARVRDHRGTVRGFLGTIAYRLAVQATRRTKRERSPLTEDIADATPTALDTMIRAERERTVAQAIRSLAAEQREAMVLRFYGEHSYEEIATILDIPVGTAKSRVFYAVRSCRELLKTKGVL